MTNIVHRFDIASLHGCSLYISNLVISPVFVWLITSVVASLKVAIDKAQTTHTEFEARTVARPATIRVTETFISARYIVPASFLIWVLSINRLPCWAIICKLALMTFRFLAISGLWSKADAYLNQRKH